MAKYNPADWYWIVAGDTTKVWSSKRSMYVPPADATYVEWLKDAAPTRINAADELVEVLNNRWVQPVLDAGVSVVSTSTPSLNGTYALDQKSQAAIASISTGISAGKGLPGGGPTFVYAGITFTSAQFLDLASALEGYVYSFLQSLSTIVTTGSGSMPSATLTIP